MKCFNIFFIIFTVFCYLSCEDDSKNAVSIMSEPCKYKYYLKNMDKEYLSRFRDDFQLNDVVNMSMQQENKFLFFLRKQADIILMSCSKERQFKSIMNIFAALNYKKHSYSKYNAFFLIKYKHYSFYQRLTLVHLSNFNGKSIYLSGILDNKKKMILNVRLVFYEEKLNVPYNIFCNTHCIKENLDLNKYQIEDFNLPTYPTYFDLILFFLSDKKFLSFDDKANLLEYWENEGIIHIQGNNIKTISNRSHYDTWCG